MCSDQIWYVGVVGVSRFNVGFNVCLWESVTFVCVCPCCFGFLECAQCATRCLKAGALIAFSAHIAACMCCRAGQL